MSHFSNIRANFFIYELYDPRDNTVGYVGMTMHALETRRQQHISESRNEKSSNSRKRAWIQEMLSNGIEPQIRVVTTAKLEKTAEQLEKQHIQACLEQGIQLTNCQHTPNKPVRRTKEEEEENSTKEFKVASYFPGISSEEMSNIMWSILHQHQYSVTREKIKLQLLEIKHYPLEGRAKYSLQELINNLPYTDVQLADICKLNEQTILSARTGGPISGHRIRQLLLYLSWIYGRRIDESQITDLNWFSLHKSHKVMS